MIGKTLGKYRIIENLGSGGTAEVYKAYQPGLDRHVAIKVLHPFLADEKDFLTRFQREARVVATLRHPNIVQVYDFDFDAEDNAYYMVMECIDGPSLKTHLQDMAQEGQRLPLEETIRVVAAVANALDYAHQHGMVHRDVKPANIMFAQDGQVILTDFGIAKMLNVTGLTASGAMVGTPAYMAPEQGMGQAGDERADIYSLGVVLYELVTGHLPFDADTPLGIVLKHINAPLPPPTDLNPNLSPGIETVITRALAKDPNDRYQTANEFASDLERAMAGQPIEPIPPELTVVAATSEAMTVGPPSATPTPPATSVVRPGRGCVAMLAVALVLILLGCAALLATGTLDRLSRALFPQAGTPTPDVIGTPTPNEAVATQIVAEIDAALATRDALATYEATTGVTPTPPPTPTPTSTPTPTPDLTATAIAACVFDMEVVNDPQVWPRVLTPRQRFVKHWKIENTGTCAWPENAELVFVSGSELEIIEEPEIEPLSPGETAEIEMTLRAPPNYGDCNSTWQLQDSEGNPIGAELEITCRVGPTPTPRPTATPTATPTPELTPTPMVPLHFSVPVIVDWHNIPDDRWWAQIGLTAEGGDGNYRYYLNEISEETEFLSGTFEYEGRRCAPWVGTVIVISAGEEKRWTGRIHYPGVCH
ncbi:MAG: protein kinase [Anaerolineae bacterium]|nr:protein kinase [Anaerolineae bacterium]